MGLEYVCILQDLYIAEVHRVLDSVDDDTPFFLYLALQHPHMPLQVHRLIQCLFGDLWGLHVKVNEMRDL